ncbi:hypothetical protein [Micromonospora orduensis]|uniref:hypothetical protein n=1 Tax=Micromonospora orduensis TaxID=1420891 RepID=UPI001FCB7A66|nr:hypothetical protein [Micromonospora orduensis]
MGARVGVAPAVGARDTAGPLDGTPLARGDSPGNSAAVDDPVGVGVGSPDGTGGSCGNGNAGGGDPASGAGLRPRYAPKATMSSTTITTTPASTTIQGDEAMATGPLDGRRARRMPDMYLPQQAVRAA